MRGIKPIQKVYDIVQDIADTYRLPSIQRTFVWEEERICKLMDSLMNEYPIGSFLVWKPSPDIHVRTRSFVQGYKSGERIISEDEKLDSSFYLVLDGQQRLQSLYLAFFGKYEGKKLYFKVDCNPLQEESGVRYEFKFMTTEEAANDSHWIHVNELTQISIPDIQEFVDEGFKNDPVELKKQITKNIGKFIQIFVREDKIHIEEVKENLSYDDVLEVFVRVNSGGVVLTKSDLLFSTVVLYSPKMEGEFVELVDELNGDNDYEFNTDFIIKCSSVLLDKGAKYDVKKLKDGAYLKNLEENFENIKRALVSTREFLKTDAKILVKRFLKSDLALIPIVDFIYRRPHQQLGEGQAEKLCRYLYMSFFMRFYSYGPDGKLDAIHKKIKDNNLQQNFPINEISTYMAGRTNLLFTFAESMLCDLDLILNIIQGGVYEIQQKRGWSLEQDHIFPEHLLLDKKIPKELINDVGNLRFINKTRNILKYDNLPDENADFYGSDNEALKELFKKARNDLNEETFRSFVQKRKELIKNKVIEFLGFDEGKIVPSFTS